MASKPRHKALLDVAELLAPGVTSVARDVTLALEQPLAYLKKRRRLLDDRNVDLAKPPKDLPWLALVIALAQARLLSPIDHKSEWVDIRAALGRLTTRPKASFWSWTKRDAKDLAERSTLELLELVGQRAQECDLGLGQIDISSDSFELVFVQRADAKRLSALAKRAGYGEIGFFTGEKLAALERQRKKKLAAELALERKSPHRQRQFIHPDGRVWLTWGDNWMADGKRHHRLEMVSRRLGVATKWNEPGINDQKISLSKDQVAKWRQKEIERRLREGYLEVSVDEFRARDENAKSKSKPRKKR